VERNACLLKKTFSYLPGGREERKRTKREKEGRRVSWGTTQEIHEHAGKTEATIRKRMRESAGI